MQIWWTLLTSFKNIKHLTDPKRFNSSVYLDVITLILSCVFLGCRICSRDFSDNWVRAFPYLIFQWSSFLGRTKFFICQAFFSNSLEFILINPQNTAFSLFWLQWSLERRAPTSWAKYDKELKHVFTWKKRCHHCDPDKQLLHSLHLRGHVREPPRDGIFPGSSVCAHYDHNLQETAPENATCCSRCTHVCAQHHEDGSVLTKAKISRSKPYFHRSGFWINTLIPFVSL